MNEEQLQQGRDALIALGWEAESIESFAMKISERSVKKRIAEGLTPYLKRTGNDLNTMLNDLNSLICHIEDFTNG